MIGGYGEALILNADAGVGREGGWVGSGGEEEMLVWRAWRKGEGVNCSLTLHPDN